MAQSHARIGRGERWPAADSGTVRTSCGDCARTRVRAPSVSVQRAVVSVLASSHGSNRHDQQRGEKKKLKACAVAPAARSAEQPTHCVPAKKVCPTTLSVSVTTRRRRRRTTAVARRIHVRFEPLELDPAAAPPATPAEPQPTPGTRSTIRTGQHTAAAQRLRPLAAPAGGSGGTDVEVSPRPGWAGNAWEGQGVRTPWLGR